MPTLQRHEGFLQIDNRAPHESGIPVGRPFMEFATLTCNHCQRQMIKNPERVRERSYCTGCDHYICDYCGAQRALTGECKPFEQLVAEVMNAAETGKTLILPSFFKGD